MSYDFIPQTVHEIYQRDVLAGKISVDESQQPVIECLERLNVALQTAGESHRASWWQRWRLGDLKPAHYVEVQGLYLWGGVGCGKTYLMDCFFEAVPLKKKRRYHFHDFMQQIQKALQQHQGQMNPLEIIADELSQEVRLFCLDEMFVQDITDAMILGKLFNALFERGICIVITSNIACQNLYRNGLQRARFLPAIELLQKKLHHWELISGKDHRLRQLQQVELYHFPITQEGTHRLQHIFSNLSPKTLQSGGVYQLCERPVPVLAVGQGVIWFTFAVLCQTARNVADYIELACYFHSVIIADVPVLTSTNAEAVRRFVHLVDAFYDKRVKLVILAQVGIADLYQDGELKFEFERTRSRLIEMQSKDYLSSAHRPW